jgi:beta-phosphoglucomutase-like phosphatase (HAD superfamily)
MAMHEIGLYPEDFGKAVGFEDSESGTIAIRAAGIRVCCALPFHMTAGHHFEAATRVCPGGLPEVMLKHGLFLRESLLDI